MGDTKISTTVDEDEPDVEPISLSDLHGTKLVWEGPDGDTHESEPFTCDNDDCTICSQIPETVN